MLSPEQAAFARRQRLAHLATTGAGGRPHVLPVAFALLDDAFYFAVDEKPKRTKRLQRLRNIEHDPRVALVIDRYDEDWSKLGWLMVQGSAAVVGAADERSRVVAALRDKYEQYRNMTLAGPVVRIVPEKLISWGDIG